MERQLWKVIVLLIKEIEKPKVNVRNEFSDEVIVKIWMWAVIHDRPVSWACCCENWPLYERRWKRPSNTTMSRRLSSPNVQHLLQQLEKRVLRSQEGDNLVWFIDGKPLVISGCSKDRQAGYGRASGGKAKGYKLHAIVGSDGSVSQWRVAPMNCDERVMAKRMLKVAMIQGYVVADANYDSNKLHSTCEGRGNLQFITPRRYGAGRGFGHRKQTESRIRSAHILEDPFPEFGLGLMQQRVEIERYFGNLTNWGGGLTCLPAWARTHRRVHRWVQAKLNLNSLKRSTRQTTYVDS